MTGNLKHAMLAALLAGLAVLFLVNTLTIDWYPPTWTLADGRSGYYPPTDIRSCMGARVLAILADRAGAFRWHRCATTLHATQALAGFDWRYWSLIAACVWTLAAAFGFALATRICRPPHRVLRGRRLLIGAAATRAFLQSAKAELAQSGRGLELVPNLAVSRDRESRHWLIWGSVGAGKTQTMLHLVLAALERGDGVLVIDVKGDMTATLPGAPLLIAPQDRRSLTWDVARDCRTKQAARELAARIIPGSHDPMWSDAAREILVVCIATLQATKGDRWTWRDLHEIGTSSADALLEMARRHHCDAARLLESPDSRTTQSVLSTFQTHMNVVASLADAWHDDANGRFAVSDWLHAPTQHRPVILQHDSRHPELSSIWIGGVLGLLASHVGSPSLAESRTRRTWIFADEFPQLPRLDHFSTLLDLGRSKGVIAVICAQDLAQLRATYGRERADAWVGMIGTKIITRLNAGRGAEEASQLIGEQEIEREEKSETIVGGKRSVTRTRRRDIRRVITADEIATRLGPRGDHIRVLMLGLGADALELQMPFVALPVLRPGHVPADWATRVPDHVEAVPARRIARVLVMPTLSKGAADRIREIGE